MLKEDIVHVGRLSYSLRPAGPNRVFKFSGPISWRHTSVQGQAIFIPGSAPYTIIGQSAGTGVGRTETEGEQGLMGYLQHFPVFVFGTLSGYPAQTTNNEYSLGRYRVILFGRGDFSRGPTSFLIASVAGVYATRGGPISLPRKSKCCGDAALQSIAPPCAFLAP